MNGRIYDPVLGRFLSADVVVQFPCELQSYNRYSYSTNNPLRYIDPTGFTISTTDVEFAKYLREALQRIIGDSAKLTINAETKYRTLFGFSFGGRLGQKTEVTIRYQDEAEGAVEGSKVWSDLKTVIDSKNNIHVARTNGNSRFESGIFGGSTAYWNPNERAEVYVYDPSEPDPTKIYLKISPPEITLWHEMIGHASQDFGHHPLVFSDNRRNFFPPSFPANAKDTEHLYRGSDGMSSEGLRLARDYDSGISYDPAIQKENEAREAMRDQGNSEKEYWPRVHQYYAAFPGQTYKSLMIRARKR